jgi:preprotein translocase subunit YajC
MSFSSHAYAQEGAAAPASPSALVSFFPLILIFVIFYFLLIRPQQKKAKEHREMVSNLKKGDHVVTSGGIYGTVTNVSDDTVNIEIANQVRIKVTKSHVSSRQ